MKPSKMEASSPCLEWQNISKMSCCIWKMSCRCPKNVQDHPSMKSSAGSWSSVAKLCELCVGRMAFRKAALSTTNIEFEAESAFRWLDAFQEVLRLAAGISTCAIWVLTICQLITSSIALAQGKLLVHQASARFVRASMPRFITRNVVTFTRHEEANLAPKEVLKALGFRARECAQTHWSLTIRQQGAFLVAKCAQKFLIVCTNIAIQEVFRSCQWICGVDLYVLAASQVVHRPNLVWQQAIGGLVRRRC
mmetsp:Transcript_82833/g.115053  ORF Transcript_82833/g.115053 Transcript_82833/m.115053 type:complete len:250 (-) Transcript_82833:316-1065(-)